MAFLFNFLLCFLVFLLQLLLDFVSLVDNLLSALLFEVLYRRPDHEAEVEDQHQTYAEQCKVLDHSLSFS